MGERQRRYRRIGFDMGLNEVAKLRVVFEPLVVFLGRKALIPERTRQQQDEAINENDRSK